ISRHARFFCEDGSGALFVIRCCDQESGNEIDTTAAEMPLGLVRVLPYVPRKILHALHILSSSVESSTYYFMHVSLPMPDMHTLSHP
ncbi:unnamed protein product, partial [Ascophyllum nodosum]